MAITMPVEMYTDGSSLRNPGAAGLAWILRYREEKEADSMPEEKTLEGFQGFRKSTNNRMELMAFIYGTGEFLSLYDEGLFSQVAQLSVFSDSDYLVRAITQNWVAKWEKSGWMTSSFNGKQPKAVANKDLWVKITELQSQLKKRNVNLAMTHVMGHSGHEWNERADKLATTAASQSAVEIDTEYENAIKKDDE